MKQTQQIKKNFQADRTSPEAKEKESDNIIEMLKLLYINQLKERHNATVLTTVANSLANVEDVNEGNDIIVKTYNEIRAINTNKTYKLVNISDSSEDWALKFKARQKNPEMSRGMMTGFSVLDHPAIVAPC